MEKENADLRKGSEAWESEKKTLEASVKEWEDAYTVLEQDRLAAAEGASTPADESVRPFLALEKAKKE